MRTFAPQTIASMDDLALRVATHGVDSERGAVSTLVRQARRAGLDPVLSDVVVDPRESFVARQRAFGEIVTGLARASRDRTRSAQPLPDVAWPAHAALR
jgi:hypothetical protein